MSSRVVHVRVKDKSLWALIQYLEAEGRSYEGTPLATIVASVIYGSSSDGVFTCRMLRDAIMYNCIDLR